MAKKKIVPKQGMLVAIPLENDMYSIAVVCLVEDHGSNVYSTVWAFYNIMEPNLVAISQLSHETSRLKTPFLVCGMDYEELEKGEWPVVGQVDNLSFDNISQDAVHKQLKVSQPGAMLLEMYLGITPWNTFRDPEYLDKLLLPGYGRPQNITFK